jgi:uncharacterized protein YabN with tetrapyrrole methylase and pyrophosphatase domain
MSDDLPESPSALSEAHALTADASRSGFDWPDVAGVWAKVREELAELEEAAASGQPERVEAELGDLLFSVVNLSRFLGPHPEAALRGASQRFRQRFGHVVSALAARGKRPEQSTLDEMEALWQEAKRLR